MKQLRTIFLLIAALVVGMPAAMAQQALITSKEAAAIARDALALFPDSQMKSALAETVDFCIARTH